MIIRKEQLSVFQDAGDLHFIRRLMAALRENNGDALILIPPTGSTAKIQQRTEGTMEMSPIKSMPLARVPEDTLFELVKGGIAKARKYGFEDEHSLSAFVATMVEIAPNFDNHPLIQQMLKDENIPQLDRMDRLLDDTLPLTWELVAEDYDVTAWMQIR